MPKRPSLHHSAFVSFFLFHLAYSESAGVRLRDAVRRDMGDALFLICGEDVLLCTPALSLCCWPSSIVLGCARQADALFKGLLQFEKKKTPRVTSAGCCRLHHMSDSGL
jgi:hypothetical protein